jgi:hypothetical protein
MIDSLDPFEPDHATSPTGEVIERLELHGYSPSRNEVDLRPLPETTDIAGTVTEIFDALCGTLGDTCLAPDLEGMLWSTVNLFHRAADRIQRQLDRNVDAQGRAQQAQDGSEVQSVVLERLIEEGQALTDRRDGFEAFRDQAAELFEVRTGSPWRPRAGSVVSHKALTASVIDSRDYIAAKRRTDNIPLLPAGTRIALAGGLDFNDHTLIWDVLDKVRGKYPDMVLVHGASPRGAEFIASKWATNRQVVQIEFRPDWTRHAKAAPFKRNDELLQSLPKGLIVFPGSGITENIADKAKRLGIPVWRFGERAP